MTHGLNNHKSGFVWLIGHTSSSEHDALGSGEKLVFTLDAKFTTAVQRKTETSGGDSFRSTGEAGK